MSEANQVNSDGSCSHLYEIGEDDRRQILKRYRKVMNWCVSEDMRIDTALRNGIIVSTWRFSTAWFVQHRWPLYVEPFPLMLGLLAHCTTTFWMPPM
jgi:hypothetical protein